MDEKNDTTTEGGNSIQSWYDSMFKRAKHSIYIEDQFLFQDKAITQVLVNRLREEEESKDNYSRPNGAQSSRFYF